MAGFTPLTLAELIANEATAFASQPGVKPANTNAGSTAGPLFNAVALLGLFLQNENVFLEQNLRLASIPALPNGAPNPDVDSFVNPFGVTRLGAVAASGNLTFSLAGPTSQQLVVPSGAVVSTNSNVQFTVQPFGSGYNVGLGGYPITIGNSSVTVPVLCNQTGIIGNVAADTPFAPVGGAGAPIPAGIVSITNASEYDNGVATESDAALKARFTLTVSSGRVGTAAAIIAAVLAVQTGIIYSFGDQINPDGSAHEAFFTFIVNEADTGTTVPPALVTAATAAINNVRSAGISFVCQGPTIVPVNGAATITRNPVFSSGQVQAAVSAQYDAFVNGIGLNPGTTPTLVSLAQVYATLLQTQINGVNAVLNVDGLTLNSGTSDISVPFGSQAAAGSGTWTVP